MTLSNIAPVAGVQISSVLHRERTAVYGLTTPDKAVSVAQSLVEAAQASQVTDAVRAHAQAALNGASGNLSVVCDDYTHMACFQQTALAASPFGDSAGIAGTSEADVAAYRASHYGGANAIVVGTGAVDHDALCEVAAQLPAEANVNAAPKENCQFTGGYIQGKNVLLIRHSYWSNPPQIATTTSRTVTSNGRGMCPASTLRRTMLALPSWPRCSARGNKAINTPSTPRPQLRAGLPIARQIDVSSIMAIVRTTT